MGYNLLKAFEPPDPTTVAICPLCLGEIYDYMDYKEDEKGRLVHSMEGQCNDSYSK